MSSAGARRRVVVAAVGSPFRRDDAAGPAVLDRVGRGLPGVDMLGAMASPLHLLGEWDGADLAVVVDAVAGIAPGGVCVMEVESPSAPGSIGALRPAVGSHGLGVIDAFRIADALGTAPARLVLVGVAGEDFGEGAGLSPGTERAVARAADLVVELAGVATATGSASVASPR